MTQEKVKHMERRPRRRPSRPARQLARRILVVTEGTRTEPQYVEGLNKYLRSKGATACVKSFAVGKDPLKVVQKCIVERDGAVRNGKRFDDCVCLVDVDEHHALSAAISLAEQEEIQLLVSNLKFEVWLRWHAERKRAPLTSNQLDELVTKLGLVKKKILSPTFPFDGVHDACALARTSDPDMRPGRKGPNPSSAMPILVDLLQGNQTQGN
ncbi:MAG: RloB family protein [Corynebacterium flavescens]